MPTQELLPLACWVATSHKEIDMTFKQLYASIKQNLQKCVNGETLVFTHRGFYGYKFEVKAVERSKKEAKQ